MGTEVVDSITDRRLYYAEHFVVVMHYFAFALVMVTTLVHVYGLAQRVPPLASLSPPVLDWIARSLYVLYAVLIPGGCASCFPARY